MHRETVGLLQSDFWPRVVQRWRWLSEVSTGCVVDVQFFCVAYRVDRSWTIIPAKWYVKPALGQRIVFAGMAPQVNTNAGRQVVLFILFYPIFFS